MRGNQIRNATGNIIGILLYNPPQCYDICSVNRLLAIGRPSRSRGSAVKPCCPRNMTGVPPETPVSNLCPLSTVKPRSPIGGGPANSESILVRCLRRQYMRSIKPKAARSIRPPTDPTIAGTKGTIADLPDEGVTVDVGGGPGTLVGEDGVNDDTRVAEEVDETEAVILRGELKGKLDMAEKLLGVELNVIGVVIKD